MTDAEGEEAVFRRMVDGLRVSKQVAGFFPGMLIVHPHYYILAKCAAFEAFSDKAPDVLRFDLWPREALGVAYQGVCADACIDLSRDIEYAEESMRRQHQCWFWGSWPKPDVHEASQTAPASHTDHETDTAEEAGG